MKLIKKLFMRKEENAGKFSTVRKILVSVMMICLLSSALITATTALFSGEKEVETHIVTGNLDFEFKRSYLAGEAINDKGFLTPVADDEDVDFSQSGAKAFDITKMVPGATYIGTFELKNTGSTAFEANITFINLDSANNYLLEQIQVSFEYDGQPVTYSLSDFNNINFDLGVFAAGDVAEFYITIALPAATGNDAQNSNVNFDLRLVATQVLYEN